MEKTLKIIIPLIFIFLLLGCDKVEKQYQADMDIIRIADIDYISGLILEYLKKVKRLPLQSNISNKDIQVFITHRELPDWLLKQTKSLPVESLTTDQLKTDLEKELGREIKLPSDPQNVATYAPNVYIYIVSKEWACLAGHLYSASQKVKTKNVQDKYHKYEICYKSKLNN